MREGLPCPWHSRRVPEEEIQGAQRVVPRQQAQQVSDEKVARLMQRHAAAVAAADHPACGVNEQCLQAACVGHLVDRQQES